ncbi:MAG: ABC transporter substrate-binding protein [Roseiflexaceae bacterium]
MGEQPPKRGRMIGRREFFRLSAMMGAGIGLAACGGGTPAAPTAAPVAPAEPTAAPPPAPTEAPVVVPTTPPVATAVPVTTSKFNEAPMLADLVKAGKLPPVDERLPKNPVVLKTQGTAANYGGTIRRGFSGVSDYFGPNKVQQIGLTWVNDDLSLRADIIESWEVSTDARVWTLKLREGMKWSDGTEFTTDDWKWWYENVLTNKDLETQSNTGRGAFISGKPPVLMTAEFPDATTAIFSFNDPKPLFLYTMLRGQPFVPSAYMKQFHADFADKAELDAKVKEAGFETWVQLFNDRNRPNILGRPSVGRWLPSNDFFKDQLFVMERNPYFHQVDGEGNQLPYIDKVSHLLFESPDAFSTRIVAGEVDYQARHVSIGNFTLFKENEAKGDYKVLLGTTANHVAFQPNHTTKNPKLREFFQDRNVRLALSYAINRQEINDLVYNGTATPRQYSPLKASPQYYPKQAEAHIAYDPAKANELLDAAGYDKKDAEGFRLWKDGSEAISFIIEGTAVAGSPDEDAVQTMVKYFADVGIKATYKAVERALYTEHFNANEIEAAFWGGDRTLLPLVAPFIFMGTIADRPWAVAWGLKFNNAEDPNGEDPPEGHFITRIWDIMEQVNVEPDDTKRTALFHQVLDIWAEELPMIGILGELPQPVIVKSGLIGMPDNFPIDDPTSDEHIKNTQTFFWDDPSKHTS